MRITARLSYGLRALVVLAGSDGPVKGDVIAAQHDLSVGFVEVVLGEMRRAGLVRSKRGAQGGYWLARPAQDITVADVIRVLDSDAASTREDEPDLAPAWRFITEGYMDAAGQLTIARLAASASGGAEQVPAVAGDVEEDRDPPVGLGAGP